MSSLDNITEEELLKTRICDLPIRIEGSWLSECIQSLYDELNLKGIPFNPLCYLTDEWMTPENEPLVGIPFYLAHPALMRLERKMMAEVEGGTKEWCMQLLRHETGHAISYAYLLHKKRTWQRVFGKSSQEYTETYRFRPYSKNFVRHLAYHYAQYHPDEDFAETFAVWLSPHLNWKEQYNGWKALQKLEFVDKLMSSLRDKPALVTKGKSRWQVKSLRITLGNYYKRRHYTEAEDYPDFHDPALKRIFVENNSDKNKLASAASVIQHNRSLIVNSVAHWTGERKYLIKDQTKMILKRCRALKLLVPSPESASIIHLVTYITTLMMNYRYTGWYRGEKSIR